MSTFRKKREFSLFIYCPAGVQCMWVITFNISNQWLTQNYLGDYTVSDESCISKKKLKKIICMRSYLYHLQNSSQLYLLNILAHQKNNIHKNPCRSLCEYVTVHAFNLSTLNLFSATSAGSIRVHFHLITHCIKWLTWCLHTELCFF